MNRAVWLVVAGVLSLQVGAATAKGLFDVVTPTGMTWLRLSVSAVILLAIARPRLRGRTRADWATAVGFGVALATMNWSIYLSFSRIPLGIAVTIEFIGPLAVAVLGSRRRRDLLWAALAGAGVLLLGVERADLDPVGVAYALLAGVAWAGYILLSARTGARWPGLDGLAVANLVAVLPMTPYVLLGGGTVGAGTLFAPDLLAIGLVVGLMSSVLPYSCELVALRSLRPSTFGILMSLEPAAAALAALLLLGEVLAPLQWLALLCVVVAVAGASRAGPPRGDPGQVAPVPD